MANHYIQLRYSIQEESQNQAIRKDARYVNVQVVLLLTLIVLYQGLGHEVILKYGNGDISESS